MVLEILYTPYTLIDIDIDIEDLFYVEYTYNK